MLKILVEKLFKDDEGKPINLTEGQNQIINKIVYPVKMKTMILTPTRYGKSFTIAMGAIIKACMFPGRKIRIVSGTGEQSKIIQNYIIKHLFDSPLIYKMLSANKGKRRIQKELSKKKIQFSNGSEISTLSADILNKGRQLLGHGATDLIIDETAIIPDEIYYQNLLRMIGDSLDGKVFEITNPINRNHAWETWNDETTDTLHINYKQGLEERRFSEEYISEMKRQLTERQFKIMYDAEFPPGVGENQLYKDEWVREMFNEVEFEENTNLYYIGADIAAEGNDFTVIIVLRESVNGMVQVERIIKYDEQDTMVTAGRILKLIQELPTQCEKIISLDCVGLGKGCYDRVAEEVDGNYTKYQNVTVVGFKSNYIAGDEEHYNNLKSEMGGVLYNLLLEKKIKSIKSHDLQFEIGLIRETTDSKGRLKVVDPDTKLSGEPPIREKSPDFYDALLIALYSWKKGGVAHNPISAKGWK